MPLTSFVVVGDYHTSDNSVLVQSFDGPQIVLTFISHATIASYFERNLTPDQCNLLIDRNLQDIERLISDKYDRSLTTPYVSGTQIFPRIDLTLDDLRGIPGRLTYSVLAVAAGANLAGRPLLSHLTDFQVIPQRDQLTGFVLMTCRAGDLEIEVSIPRQDLDALASSRGWGRGRLKPSIADYLVGANLDTLAPIIEARYNRGEVSQHTSLVFHKIMPLVVLTRDDLERGITQRGRRAVHTSPVPGALVVDGIELIPELMTEPTNPRAESCHLAASSSARPPTGSSHMATKSMYCRSRRSPWIGNSQRTSTKSSLRKRETSCCGYNAATQRHESAIACNASRTP